MLILTRTMGGAVCIGDDIKIRVLFFGPKWVEFEVSAPEGTTFCYINPDGHKSEARAIGRTLEIPRGDCFTDIIHPNGTKCRITAFRPNQYPNHIKIGFLAPRSVSVVREELIERGRRLDDIHTAPGTRFGALAVVGLLAVMLTGCATGRELNGAWFLTVGRAGTCRVVEHRATTDQLETRTTWRGEGCAHVDAKREGDGAIEVMP